MLENNQSFHQELTQKYYDLIEKLNKEGTERSRNRIMEIDLEQKRVKKEMEDFVKWKDSHEADNDYNFKNIRFGNELINKEVIPTQNKKINGLIDFNKETLKCTSEANQAAKQAVQILSESRKDNRKFLRGLWVSLFIMVAASIYTHSLTVNVDTNNQTQLVQYLDRLIEKLENLK